MQNIPYFEINSMVACLLLILLYLWVAVEVSWDYWAAAINSIGIQSEQTWGNVWWVRKNMGKSVGCGYDGKIHLNCISMLLTKAELQVMHGSLAQSLSSQSILYIFLPY